MSCCKKPSASSPDAADSVPDEPVPYSQEEPLVEPTVDDLKHDNARLRAKVHALAGMLASTRDLLSLEQEKVEALKWELLLAMKVGHDEQQDIVERLELQLGTAPDWDSLPKQDAYATIALLLAGKSGEFKQNIPEGPDTTAEAVADAIISKAGPGLRRDYVLSLVRGFPAEHAEQATVDLQGLWDECDRVRESLATPATNASIGESKEADEGKEAESKDGEVAPEEAKDGAEEEAKDGEEEQATDGATDGARGGDANEAPQAPKKKCTIM